MAPFKTSKSAAMTSSNVWPLVCSTVRVIAAGKLPVVGPTATMSGAFGSVLSNSCKNQPMGTSNLMSCSTLSNIESPIGGEVGEVGLATVSMRCGSSNSRRSGT